MPLDTQRPFTRAQAIAAGLSAGILRGPRFRRLFRNVYIDAGVAATASVRIEAALLIHPTSAYASHHSAAVVHRLPVPDDHRVHVSVFAKADRRHREGISHHLAPADAAVTTVAGLRVSTPLQVFLEMASSLNLVELVVLGDAMVKRGLLTLDGLVAGCAAATGRGAAEACRAASYVRERVDSPMETRLRMLLVLAGLPEPVVDFRVHRRDGSVMLRFDLCYPGLRIVVEYDGQQHRADLDQWEVDLRRDDWFDDGGWKVVRVISRGIYRRPDETLARVHRALRARGCRDLPAALSDAWRPYFPVRP